MNPWPGVPFLRYSIVLIISILSGPVVSMTGATIVIVVTGYVVIFRVLIRFRGFRNWNWLSGIILLLIIFLVGQVRSAQFDERNQPDHISGINERVSHYWGIVDFSSVDSTSTRLVLKISGVSIDHNWKHANGKVRIYINDSTGLIHGNMILVRGSFSPFKVPNEPWEFDFGKHYGQSNIYHQDYLNPSEVAQIGFKPPSWHRRSLDDLRSRIRKTLFEILPGTKERGVALAMLLGSKVGLPDEVYRLYSSTGASHILAVSGLHTGVFFMIFAVLLGYRRSRGRWKIVKGIVIILFLWIYASITGLSPSVTRSATMFTIFIVASAWGRKSNSLNSVCLAAFVMMITNPFVIHSVGFQLSFAAVTGIIVLVPAMEDRISVRNPVKRYLWQLWCVSWAAQLATLPFTVFYFHQFPVYFWVTNMVAVPGAFLILVTGLITIVLHSLGIGFLNPLLEIIIRALNSTLDLISRIPGAVVEGIWISGTELWILILALVFFMAGGIYRRLQFLPLILILIFTVINLNNRALQRENQFVRIHKARKHTLVDFVTGRNVYSLYTPDLPGDSVTHGYVVKPFREYHGLSTVISGSQLNGNSGFRITTWENGLFLVINTKVTIGKPVDVDFSWVLVENNAVHSLSRLKGLRFDYLVIGASNDFYIAERLKREAEDINLEFHSIIHHGPLTLPTADETH